MTFVKFEIKLHRAKRNEGVFITVAKDCTRLTFSYPLTEWINSQEVKNVDFLFDTEAKLIAFQKEDASGYRVQCRQRSQAYVSGRCFLKSLNIEPGRYEEYVDQKNCMIVAQFAATHTGDVAGA